MILKIIYTAIMVLGIVGLIKMSWWLYISIDLHNKKVRQNHQSRVKEND